MNQRIILGIDPGTVSLGYAVISVQDKKVDILVIGELNLKKLDNQQLKLKMIFEQLLQVIDMYLPDECAVEVPFFAKNPQSLLKLGRAQGVAMAAALYRQIPVAEYYPTKVKAAITGNGRATKEQLFDMIQKLLGKSLDVKTYDASDALGVALCHCYQNQNQLTQKSTLPKAKSNRKSSWNDFVKTNQDKIIKKT
ncbi:MAG: crossover junction endodeoxyribonuclease RuvC [Chitinophagales bacterium]|nr:crossover junction endodeoxyribonuclease RuvC [Chitinophagales bacterium]